MKTKFFLVLVSTLLLLSVQSFGAENDIPTVKVTGKDKTFISILVPKNTTKAQLTNLINEFKKARENSYLEKYFPPTTPNGSYGKFAVIGVFVFSNPQMATSDAIKKYMNTADGKFSQKFADAVLAHYYYGFGGDHEFGCLGLQDSDIKPTKNYQKLFSKNYPY